MKTDEIFKAITSHPLLVQPSELSHFAAAAALKELLKNWECAIDDNFSVINLLKDIDDVALQLQDFKIVIENHVLKNQKK